MSLIYDYLKIDGKSGSERDADIEIPPALKRRDDSKLSRQSLLLLLGACFIGIFFIFLVFRIFNPGQNEQAADVAAPVPQVQQDQPEPLSAPRQPVALETAAARPPAKERAEAIQVFPEKEKPVATAAGSGAVAASALELGPVRRKMIQPLELQNKDRKITFPENIPVYTEPREPAENLAAVAPVQTGSRAVSGAKGYTAYQVNGAPRETTRKFYQAGQQAQHNGDSRTAEIYYLKALEAEPQHMDALINLSALYVQQERYYEAEEILAQILAIEPENSKALVNLGMVSLSQGNDSLAETQFKAALAANPREENGLVNLAYLAEKNGDYAATESYYRQLLQISPDNLEVLLAYGHLLEELRRYPEAMALYGDTRELAAVKKDQQLYRRISERMRLLAGVIKK